MVTRKYECAVAILIAAVLGANTLWAATPTEQVKATVDRVMEILKDKKLQGEAKREERRERLRQVILPRFDFAEMAKRSLGTHWNRNPTRQKEFISVFTELLEDAYTGKVEAAKGEKVLYLNGHTDQSLAEVKTKVVSAKGEETSINYKMHPVGSEWKVYDVLIENISMVNNYRSQFNRVLANASFDELLKKLKEKNLRSDT
jgi:phospholipid transport system substrate-binding protein